MPSRDTAPSTTWYCSAMGFKRKSSPVHPKDQEVFAKYPVFFAVLIDAGYITHWPHEWTRDGARSRRNHSDERGRYDGDGVMRDAIYQVSCYRGNDVRCIKTISYRAIGSLRGAADDKEEGDL